VAESFFQLLKRERIKRKIYTSRQDARSDVFDSIRDSQGRRRTSEQGSMSLVSSRKSPTMPPDFPPLALGTRATTNGHPDSDPVWFLVVFGGTPHPPVATDASL
jgi:hypothetical protein